MRLLVFTLLLGACVAPTPASQRFSLTGKDGAHTVSGTEVVNTYVAISADANAGDTSVSITDASAFSVGDLFAIVSSQGATIDTSDSATYGTVSALGSAGLYELWEVSAVGTGTLGLKAGCGLTGLQNAYPLTSSPQVIRVPQYTTLSVPSGATLTGTAWNGSTGGYVIVHVESSANVDGTIDASGLGLRGGNVSATAATITDTPTSYRDSVGNGGEKGESVAGSTTTYDALNGRYGRGAPANGGGGGNGYLAGGGGGASLVGTSTTSWNGAGTMLASVTGGSAWMKDPSYTPTSQGGGRGGYTVSSIDQDATMVAPGSALWGGNGREQAGGLGGHPTSGAGRLFLGGGGGAGDFDGTAPSGASGANGGGVVYLIADSLTGAGSIHADGRNGHDGQLVGTNDPATIATGGGAGGAGAGGMVVLRAIGTPSLSVSARGGTGGNLSLSGTFAPGVSAASGPGGGGAGGAVVLYSGLTLATSPTVTAGLGGTTSAPALSEFPSNGASAGDPGTTTTGVSQTATPGACLPADLAITLADTVDPVDTGGTFSYVATIVNNGPNAAYDVVVTITLPSGATSGTITASGWSCTQAGVTVTCTRALIKNGVTSTITIGETAGSSATTLSASATVASRQDPTSSNNGATETTTVQLPRVDLALDMSGPASVASAEQIAYTLTVTNDGPHTAPSFHVVDTLPAGTTYVGYTGTDWTCTQSSGTVTCSHGSLASTLTSSLLITISAPADTTADTITNSATVSLTSSGVVDPTPSNDTDSVTTNVVPVDLSITKADAVDPVAAGSAISYTITVTNPSTVTAHDIVVTDVLPTGTSYVSASGTGWTCSFASPSIHCTLPAIAAGATPSISVVLTAPSSAGVIQNTATVTSSATDPDLSDDTATEQTTIAPPAPGSADVSITLSDSPDPVDLGATLTLTVGVANAGPDAAAGVQIVGTLPAGATFVSATGTGWTCSQAATTVTCAANADLAVGAAGNVTIVLTAPSMAGTLSTSVVVVASTSDPAVANNSAVASTEVIDPTAQNQPPTLSLPTQVSTLEDTALTFATPPTIADPDARTDAVELRVIATSCVLTLSGTANLAFTSGDGILDPVLIVDGAIADLDAALDGATVTPVPGFSGAATLAFTVDDLGHNGAGGAKSVSQSMTITVIPVEHPPIVADDVATVVEDSNATAIDVLANDRPGDPGETLHVASVTQPAHGTVVVAAGVTYTPAFGYLGDDAFTYVASDGVSQSTGNVTVHVVAPTAPTNDGKLGGGGFGCSVGGTATGDAAIVFVALLLVLRRRYGVYDVQST